MSGNIANTDLSWWPQRHTWTQSGYHVEYWSSDCETWYQKRLKGIKLRTFDAKTATHWEKSLNRFKGKTAKLRAANEAASSALFAS